MTESHPTYRVYPPRRTQSVLVCPHCKTAVQLTHGFSTREGVAIATYHCREHGEVVPMRSALVNFIADQPQPVWDGEGP